MLLAASRLPLRPILRKIGKHSTLRATAMAQSNVTTERKTWQMGKQKSAYNGVHVALDVVSVP